MGQKRNRIHAPISHRLSGSLSRVLGEPDAEADGTNLAPHWNRYLGDWDHFTTRDLLHLDCSLAGQCQPIKAACSQQALDYAGKQAPKDEQEHPVAKRKTADRSLRQRRLSDRKASVLANADFRFSTVSKECEKNCKEHEGTWAGRAGTRCVG